MTDKKKPRKRIRTQPEWVAEDEHIYRHSDGSMLRRNDERMFPCWELYAFDGTFVTAQFEITMPRLSGAPLAWAIRELKERGF